ncbi:MAG: hypothetical protein QF464_10150, partial [Myxococcota bacterium]|nr:hypothetical protein [Myxococcota bacterium]
MKSIIVRVLIASLLAGGSVQASACGEDEVMERPVDPRLARRKNKKKGPPPSGRAGKPPQKKNTEEKREKGERKQKDPTNTNVQEKYTIKR